MVVSCQFGGFAGESAGAAGGDLLLEKASEAHGADGSRWFGRCGLGLW